MERGKEKEKRKESERKERNGKMESGGVWGGGGLGRGGDVPVMVAQWEVTFLLQGGVPTEDNGDSQW